MDDTERKLRKAASQKKWYEKNKARHIANVQVRKKEVRERAQKFLRELKESTPCTDCGKYYPYYVMDFDHLRDKEFQIALMPRDHDIPKIKEEVAKCEIVCVNCHRIRTHIRKNDPVGKPGHPAHS